MNLYLSKGIDGDSTVEGNSVDGSESVNHLSLCLREDGVNQVVSCVSQQDCSRRWNSICLFRITTAIVLCSNYTTVALPFALVLADFVFLNQ